MYNKATRKLTIAALVITCCSYCVYTGYRIYAGSRCPEDLENRIFITYTMFGTADFQKETRRHYTNTDIVFNAGSSAIQSLLANKIDATYVGPGPAVNGYMASQGKDLRIISGAASGGAV
ncbi:MAG: hypothetical protein WAM14_24085 [Candidatus Nitrosopolaris sp.]